MRTSVKNFLALFISAHDKKSSSDRVDVSITLYTRFPDLLEVEPYGQSPQYVTETCPASTA
jgi:hypothetical protein